MPTDQASTTDIRVIRRVLSTEQVKSIQRFRQLMGLWFWAPSVVLSGCLGVFLSLSYNDFRLGLGIAMCSLGLCGAGWFLRFYYAGVRATPLVSLLHANVPWDSLRMHSTSTVELDRINTLEGFMASDPSRQRVMSVMPMLIALVSIMQSVVQRTQVGDG